MLEAFEVSLEEAQNLVMTARVMLGWVDAAELEKMQATDAADEDEEAEA